MDVSKEKYRRLEELYTTGKTVELGKDPSGQDLVMFLQVLNPFERQEARNAAQTARTRHIMAYQEHGQSDRDRLEASFFAEGREGAIDKLLDLQMQQEMVKILDEIHDDPEWEDYLEVMDRSDELLTREPDDVERRFLDEANRKYVEEVQKRMDAERTSKRASLEHLDDEELKRQYFSAFLERRGDEVALAEFQIVQLAYGVRDCDATKNENDIWDHSQCKHEPIYSRNEIRSLPDELYDLLSTAMDNLTLSVREGKGSGRQTSSSGSSPLPSEEVVSASSTPEAMSNGAPGSSKPPSTTPSPSSDSTSSPTMSSPQGESG